MYQIHPSRHAGPKHFQANLCSFPTNVDNSQHFHFIMAQKDMPSGRKDTLRCSAGRLPGPQVVRVALGALFKILLCKFYYFYMINRKFQFSKKGRNINKNSPTEKPSQASHNTPSYPSPHFLTSQLGAHFWHFYESLTL